MPAAQGKAREWLARAGAQGIIVKVDEGARSYAEQAALYAKGRTAPRPQGDQRPARPLVCTISAWRGTFVVFDAAGQPLWTAR